MTGWRAPVADRLAGWSWSGLGRAVIRLPGRYPVSIAVFVGPVLATMLARAALGADPTPAAIDRLGYGWPTLEEGRVWTLLTGAFVARSLAVSFVPSFSFFGVLLLEHRAGSWRSAVAFLAGQVLGVLLALVVTRPLDGSSGAFARQMTQTVDFGYSVGGFAALGLWTCYLRAAWRRPLRVAISCYLVCQLLFSGLIYDVSHPIGWILGLTVGARWLLPPTSLDRRPVRRPDDLCAIAIAVVVGTAGGVVAAWNAGGVGGIFGWGPGAS